MKFDLVRSATAAAIGFAGLLWSLAFLGYAAPGIAAGDYGAGNLIYLGGSCALGVVLSTLFWIGILGTRGLGLAARVVIAAATVSVLAAFHAWIDLWAAQTYLGESFDAGPSALMSGEGVMFLNNLLYLTPTHVTYAAAVGMGLALRAVAERERRLAAALSAAQQAQLAALRFQINPHFLFNSLNAVVSLIGSGRDREAQAVVTRLAEFFRGTLTDNPAGLAALEEEFDHLEAYLDIEGVRLGERLTVQIHLPQELSRARLPHLLLQPLVENSIKHAVAPSKHPVTVAISAHRDGDHLVLTVADTGVGVVARSSEGARIGLQNVKARLAALYDGRATLAAQPSATGFRATVTLPLEIGA